MGNRLFMNPGKHEGTGSQRRLLQRTTRQETACGLECQGEQVREEEAIICSFADPFSLPPSLILFLHNQ